MVSPGTTVLGIEVPSDLLAQWRDWLMPPEQPFLLPPGMAGAAGLADDRERLSFEHGWALHKPSQGWMSPAKVLTVSEAMFSARTRGQHVQRRTLR
jgi:hypothetical protein